MRFFERKKPGENRRDHAQPECLEVREEIVATIFGDQAIVRETVSVHLAKCARCRQWEGEIVKMHEICRSPGRAVDPSRLTENVLGRPDVCGAVAEDKRSAARRRAEKTTDGGVLALVMLAVVLFQSVLAFVLRGRGVPIQAASFVAMLAAAIWVYSDSTRRGLPAAFWTALQPFTVPVGLVAYLACRSRESVRCPGCGKSILARHAFCPGCGRRLMEFCCGCGRPVRKEFRVCPHCGTRLEECFPREDEGGRACGWSANQIAFVIGFNAALLAGFVTLLVRGGTQASFVTAFLYLFGYFPIFNWVSIDSRRRAMATIAWGVLVLLTLYVGLVIYLACRRDVRIVCPVCGSYPPSSFNFCPCCGSSLGYVCPRCGASAQAEIVFCASCGERLT